MVAVLIRALALLLALATIAAHGLAYRDIATRLRPFGGEVLGINADQLLAVVLAMALTSIQFLVPADLSRMGRGTWPGQIKGWLLTAILVIGHGILMVSETALDLTAPAMSSRDIAVMVTAELCAEIAVTLLQGTAWRRAEPDRPVAVREAAQVEAWATTTTRPLRPVEQRLLLHLRSVGSELVATQAEIATAVGCSKSTANGALHGLAAAGAIRLVTTPRQTRVRLVERSKATAPTPNRQAPPSGSVADIDPTDRQPDADIDATAHHGDTAIDVTVADLDSSTPCLPAIVRYPHFEFGPLFPRLRGECVRAHKIVRTLWSSVLERASRRRYRWPRLYTDAGYRSP